MSSLHSRGFAACGLVFLGVFGGLDGIHRLFEGHAEAQSRDNNLQTIVPNLVEAMFTGFPGNSGERVRITVAPPEKR